MTRHARHRLYTMRPGVTLVELLLYVALLAFVGIAVIELLFLGIDGQVRQQTVASLEQDRLQITQLLGYDIRHAERILSPARGASGAVLVLQTADADASPMVIGVASGSLFLTHKTDESVLNNAQVVVSDMRVWNTSPSDDRPSLRILLRLEETSPLPTLPTKAQTVDLAFTLLPDDDTQSDTCGGVVCASPRCDGHGHIAWDVCDDGNCDAASGSLTCPL